MNETIFEVAVTGMDNNEWQGTLRCPDGTTAKFLSVLELLRSMETILSKKQLVICFGPRQQTEKRDHPQQ